MSDVDHTPVETALNGRYTRVSSYSILARVVVCAFASCRVICPLPVAIERLLAISSSTANFSTFISHFAFRLVFLYTDCYFTSSSTISFVLFWEKEPTRLFIVGLTVMKLWKSHGTSFMWSDYRDMNLKRLLMKSNFLSESITRISSASLPYYQVLNAMV